MLQQHPDNFDALHCLGQINYRRGRLDTALVLMQEALKADFGRADGFASLGLVFHSMRQFKEALASYDEGLAHRAGQRGAAQSARRGAVGAWPSARRRWKILIACLPPIPTTSMRSVISAMRCSSSIVLRRRLPPMTGRSGSRRKTLQLLTNRAVALRRLDRPREALMSATRALASRPDFAQARFVESVARLTLGDFAAGWRGYESRWGVGALALQRRSFTAPLWLGKEALDGKTILLHAEQGFGDTIQFVRYAPLLAGRRREKLFWKSSVSWCGCCQPCRASRRWSRAESSCRASTFIVRCSVCRLRWQRSRRRSRRRFPTSRRPKAKSPPGGQRLPQRRPLVGLAWSGARSHDNDLNRSMRLETLAPLLDLPDVQFVSLQHEVREEDAPLLQDRANVLQIGAKLRDFADTAAAIALLDAVISVDTAVAHLAGAMGKPLLLLLPFAADFRWLRERHDSPWYPTARLFRQPRFGDWDSVVEALVQELARLAAATGNSSYARHTRA